MENLEQLNILLHVIISFVLSGILGYERDKQDKPAGIRTNMFIGGSACLLILLGSYLMLYLNAEHGREQIMSDPTRLIHAIVIGVSFIGGGTILKSAEKNTVNNLTTAATLLFSACIGISVALKLYVLGIGITVAGLFINLILGWVFHGKSD